VKRALLEELRAARAAGRAVVVVTPLDGGDAVLVDRAVGPCADAIATALRTGDASVAEVDGRAVLVEPHLPPLRLVIVGAVHVAEPLAHMASLSGFAVTIVDPRRAWATEARFPGQTLVTSWPDVALAELRPDARTAVVTLTHDPKLDDPALVAALASPAFYVGCLGSKKTHAARRERLGERGVAQAALDRLHGPVGLRLGARTPAEIAVSILAEIIQTLRGAS
jgi:xanthine dehydrogenase accessory factor